MKKISDIFELSEFKCRLIRFSALLIMYTHWFSCLYWSIVSSFQLFQSKLFDYKLMLSATNHVSHKYLFITYFVIDQIYGGTLIKVEIDALLDKTFNSLVVICSYLFLFYITGNLIYNIL